MNPLHRVQFETHAKSEKEVSTIYLGLEAVFEAELERKLSSPGAKDIHHPSTPTLLQHSSTPPDSVNDAPSLDRSAPYILHVGGDTWYKNRPGVLQIYLEVRKRLGSLAPNLIMVGSPLKPEFPEVHFLRDVTDTVLVDLYRNAALLLFPSLYEGFGWPVVEAHACGCPTVITGTAPLTEADGSAGVWMDDPRDIQQGADRVMDVLREDEAKRRQRQSAGYDNARRFSRKRMAAQYRELYASLLSE